MGQAETLMVQPQAAQEHFMKALQLVERCGESDKIRMAHGLCLGESTVLRILSVGIILICT